MDLDMLQKPQFEGMRRYLRKEEAHAIVKRCLKIVYKDFRARWKHAEAVLIRERQDKNDHELLGLLLPPPTAPPTTSMTKARRELAETLWPDTRLQNSCDEMIKNHKDIRVKLRELDRDCTKLRTDLSHMSYTCDDLQLCVSTNDYGSGTGPGYAFARSLLFNLIQSRGSHELPEHFCIRRLYCMGVLTGVELALHTDATLARYCRDVMMEGKRKDADGSLYAIDIGPSQGKDGVERRLPRDIWHEIFKLL